MSDSHPRVAIIGAGLAGLGAAWRLQRGGCDVQLLERSPRAGGRFSSQWIDGWCVDRCLPLVGAGDAQLLDWIRELELAPRLLPLRRLRLEQRFEGRVGSVDPGHFTGLLRTPGVRWQDALRSLRLRRLLRRYSPLLDPQQPERAARWDDRSVADFGKLYFGQSVVDRWIGPSVMETALGNARDLSRVVFLLQCSANAPGAPFLPRLGLDELARAAAERLGIRTRTRAERIELRASEGFRISANAEARAEGTIDVDAVVVTTAGSEAARIASPLVTPAERDFLMDLSSVPSLTLSVGLDRALEPDSRLIRVPELERSSIGVALVEPGGEGGRAPAGRGRVTVAANAHFGRSYIGATDAVVTKALVASLEALLPEVRGAICFTQVERSFIPHFGVGSYRALQRFARVQRDRRALGRRLYFAGDQLCGPSAENTLVSGLRAADALLSDFSRRASSLS